MKEDDEESTYRVKIDEEMEAKSEKQALKKVLNRKLLKNDKPCVEEVD